MGFKKKTAARRAHSGIRLSKLPVATDNTHASPAVAAGAVEPKQQHVVSEVDPVFAYHEIPDELLVGSELDLSLWSVVAQDSSLQRLATPSAMTKCRQQTSFSALAGATSPHRRASSGSRSSSPMRPSNQLTDAVLATGSNSGECAPSPTRLQHQQRLDIVSLNLAGAEHITDEAAFTIGNTCPSLRHLVLERASKLTDAGVRHLVSCCRELQTLNLNYVMALQSAAVSTLGEFQLPLRELGLAGCARVPDFALQRVFHACPALETLDVSFCSAVSDQLLLSLGQHCRGLRRLKLRGCRQVSDAGVVALVNAGGGGELVLLDLARFDLQYKITDMSLLAIAEHCRVLETLVLAGCEMLTDVGVSWLCSGCLALTHVDVSGCAKLTDVAMRAVGESLLQLRHLSVSHCVRISDLGLRHLSLGCPDLEHFDAVGLTLLADPRPHDVNSFGERQYQGVAALAMRCAKLRHLDISRCGSIGDATLQCLATKSGALAELSIAGCARVTYAGVHELLVRASRLVSLSVSDCDKVGDRAFSGLLTAAASDERLDTARQPSPVSKSLRHLTSLRLRGCSHVSDSALQCLGALGLALRELDVSGCVRVSDMGILALVDAPTTASSLRSLWLRGLGAVTETALSWLADKCRKLLLLDVTGCSRIKAFSLKALATDWKFAVYTSSERFRGMAPKHRAEDWLVIEEYGDCWRSATRIQSLYRARVARRIAQQKREEKLILWVATRLQSVYRGRQARKLAILRRMQLRKETEAAQQIQSKFRQRHARAEVARVREQRHQQRIHDAARFIQMAWRRKRVRGKLQTRTLARLAREQRLQRAAVCVQRAWRGKQARTQTRLLLVTKAAHDREQHDAANKMQNLFRARAARREVLRKRQELRDDDTRRERAAMRVQAHVRRRRAQRELVARIMHAKRMHDAAACIQRRWRAKKRWFAGQLLFVARRRREEYDAAVKLQAAWKRKQGRRDARLLRLVREQAQQHMAQAALKVQTHWRAKHARSQVAAARQLALQTLLLEMQMQHRAAALVQAHFRGRRGRERYRELVLRKKQRWKRVEQPESGQTFYYNKETGEVRFRRPQDVLDLLPKPLCDNCVSPATHIAQMECKDCGEMFCNTCWLNVHAGGKRMRHEFRCLYDYYDKRVDYGDGEFPSKWPSEVEQDEKDGWALRMYPRRQAAEVKGVWERYVDAETGREWFYNKETETSSYSAPRVFQSDEPVTAQTAAPSDWTKYYDESQGVEYYYNSKTLESTFARPADFETSRQAPSGVPTTADGSIAAPLTSGRDGWEKYIDPQSGYPYYYNARTCESTFARPMNFQTARRGSVAIEAGGSDWAKYYDLAQGLYYYYNARTYESSFARPLEFATPRVARSSAASAGMIEFYDPATAKAYFYNAHTTECQFAAPFATARMHDYR